MITNIHALIERIGSEARRYAAMYDQSSDGRNTFVMFAEWVEALAPASLPDTDEVERVARLIYFGVNDGLEFNIPENNAHWDIYKKECPEYIATAQAVIAYSPPPIVIKDPDIFR